MQANTPIANLPGVGSFYSNRLEKLGIETIRDLVYHFPFRYEDFSQVQPIREVKDGEKLSIQGTIWQIKTIRTRFGKFLTQATVADESGTIEIVWFNQPYLTKTLKAGTPVSMSGKVKMEGSRPKLMSPTWEIIRAPISHPGVATTTIGSEDSITSLQNDNITAPSTLHTGRLVAVYPETEGISSKWFRGKIALVLPRYIEKLEDYLPPNIIKAEKLLSLSEALTKIHQPESLQDVELARKRLGFDELFLIQLVSLKRQIERKKSRIAPKMAIDTTRLETLVTSLPYKLTTAQKRSLSEILADLAKNEAANRLLEGDVGSGKTVVAILAAQQVAQAGLQVAVLAPTEILAQQHYQTFKNFLKNTAVRIDLLTASAKAKKEVIRLINNDFAQIVIGTHALIQDKVAFPNLGLVIIDEQHRFGIKQRARLLKNATTTPHLLSMTATPIPRTLALTMYGDLDISLIQEKPQGRQKIKTRLVAPAHKKMAYRFIDQEIAQGRQVFVICPRIELPELTTIPDLIKQEVKAVMAEHENLSKNHFPHRRVGLLHGRLKAREKQAVMTDFATGHLDILVSTSVVEVGVDVPNASVMAIENAEHFGLAQLHQFRGRVGRAQHQSHCFLLSGSPQKQENQRLKALVESDDGFALAEMDLQLRGPGQFFGAQQSGQPDLPMISLTDLSLIKKARSEAKQFLKTDPNFAKHPRLKQAFINFQKIHHFE